MKAVAAVAVLLLLAMGAQAGSSEHVLEGSTVSAMLSGPDTRLQGPLGLVDVAGRDSASMAFHLEGAMRLEVDHETVRGYGVTYDRTDAGTDRPSDPILAVDGIAGRDGRQLVVFPLEGQSAQVTLGPSSVAAATPSTLGVHHTGGTDRQPESVLGQGLRATGSSVEVRGSFVVALWEWDFNVVGKDGQSSPQWTGLRQSPVAPLPPETTSVARDDTYREAFLFVNDGVLTIPAEAKAVAFLPSAAAEVHGTLTFQGVHAAMASSSVAQDISADRFSIQGDLHMDLGAPADGRVPFQATGQGDSIIAVDGATLQWAGRSGGWPSWATWALVGIAALAAPGSAILARRGYLRWEDRRLEEAGELLELEAFEDAKRCARPLLRSRRYRGEAALIHVEALLQEGRPDEARPLLAQERLWRLAPAMRDYMLARVEAIAGNVDRARAALAAAFAAAPDLTVQAREDATLRPLAEILVEGYA